MTFNPMNFVSNLSYMAVGMVSIFIVIGVIVALTMFLNMVTNIKAIVAEEEAAKKPFVSIEEFHRHHHDFQGKQEIIKMLSVRRAFIFILLI